VAGTGPECQTRDKSNIYRYRPFCVYVERAQLDRDLQDSSVLLAPIRSSVGKEVIVTLPPLLGSSAQILT